MARELVEHLWCDLHMSDDGDRVSAGSWALTIKSPDGAMQTYEVDVCEACGKPLADVAALLDEYGRAVKGPLRPVPSRRGDAVGDYPCPADGCDSRYRTKSGLRSHTKDQHGMTYGELTGTANRPCTVPGCTRKFDTPQGVAVHLRKMHGIGASAINAAHDGQPTLPA